MEFIKKLKNEKNIKRIVSVLVVFAIYVNAISLYTGYRFLNYQRSLSPIDDSLFYGIVLAVSFTTIIYLIGYIVSLVYIYKNKSVVKTLGMPLATYKSVEDLISIGAYVKGNNPKVDQAVSKLDAIQGFLRQSREESAAWADTMEKLKAFIG